MKLTIDDNERMKHRRSLGIAAIAVDLLGYEEVASNRKAMFLALGTDLLDAKHPPPPNMTEPPNPLAPDETFWRLKPSASALPFMLSLPLDTGPPPFQSKQASIRYLVCTTALINDAGKLYRVRTCQEVHVLPTYDPEMALTSLPSPLTASDELPMPHAGGFESLNVTAGLHRQVWVSGSNIFVDVHISNKSRKLVKRLDLSLERDVLVYKHAAAATRERSAGQARIFESNNQSMLAMSSLRIGTNGWNGVEPHTFVTRTCDLELPRGHATVKCGKYFEVRYFLNVTVSTSNSKLVSVQLPIILIHMNSLDAVPNCVAQVAAAIEEKRTAHHRRHSSEVTRHRRVPSRQRSVSSPAREKELRRRPSHSQGRAFAAPRQQSLRRQRAEKADLDELCQTLDSSPRKHQPRVQGLALRKMGSNMSFGNLSLGGKSMQGDMPFHVMTYKTPPHKPPERGYEASDERASGSLRDRLRRMQSFDSFYGHKATARARSKPTVREPKPEPVFSTMSNSQQILPHTLGLSTTGVKVGQSSSRPTTASGFRDKLDRSRFEFNPVRRKASGRSMKARGVNWWEQIIHRDKDKENWI